MTKEKNIYLFVKELAKEKITSEREFLILERKLLTKYKISPPKKSKILEIYQNLKKEKKINRNLFLENKIKKRPIRSLSGIAVISVLTKPWPCPGKCIYCPKEKGIPKSYLSGEPAVERAKALNYNPYLQVQKRIKMLKENGHPTDKIELIVIGGTWSYLPRYYQTWFIKRCFQAANGKKLKNENLKKVQKINEKAKHRIVGLTLETRPDFITPEEIFRMRKLGCTRVEIGVQILDDEVLKINKRGHKIQETIKATKLLKDAGFKICYHIMPGLLGSNPKNDFEKFKKIFSDENFRPDMLKIYPCVVTKGSQLYKLWKNKKYKPYTDKKLIELLIKMKTIVPPYIRINRVIRDIPANRIEGGSKISNLREVVQKEMKKRGLKCRCIRCREIKSADYKIKDIKLIKRKYRASKGEEIFLSYEDVKNDKLLAFLRLRLPNKNNKSKIYHYFPELKNVALVRELHTYGQLISIGKKTKTKPKLNKAQHLGFGKKLMNEAEKIVKNYGYKKIAVISGIGVREYYRKLGYRLKNTYMVKTIK
ncbi:tRNA uridine(34) 5-carboxymethylaminomethyl modification radical SAM/GNAT enzyme Elp3 [bacterium]|nr:tRNA uridine(34) 5-carboxymethylaminomethyl modification radical SAM/GNAT enzyme Elp3 [bacterium]